MARKTIKPQDPAFATLPFSPGVYAGKTLFLSGQVGLDPVSGALVRGGIAAEVDQIFKNITSVLAAADKDLGDIIKTNVFLAHMDDYAAMNEAYARAFDRPFPARTCVGVAALPLGARVEIEAIAR